MVAAPNDVRTVLRMFRYATLERFIGRQFKVSTHATLRDDLMQLGQTLAAGVTLLQEDIRNLYLQIAKYGILDLRFCVEPDTFECDFEAGKQLIRRLGFGADSKAEWSEVFPEFESLMPEISNDVMQGKWYLMIHANIVGHAIQGRDLVASIRASNDLTKLPLPAEFRIVDACVTNSTYAWFSKHFYL